MGRINKKVFDKLDVQDKKSYVASVDKIYKNTIRVGDVMKKSKKIKGAK